MLDKIPKFLIIFFLSFFFSYICLLGNFIVIPSIFVFLLATLFCLRKPYFFIIFYLLVSVDFLGYINPHAFFYFPGYFKFKDIIFLLGILFVFKEIIINKSKIHFSKDSSIPMFVFILLFLVGINWMRTYYLYDVEFKSIIQYSRRYLYYLSFLFPICFIKNVKDLKYFFKMMFSICIIYSLLITIQFFAGSNFNILGNTIITKQTLGGLRIDRIYIKGLLLLCGVFIASIGYCVMSHKQNKFFYLGIFLIGCGIFLHFARMFWLFIFLTLLLWFIDIHRQYKKIFIIILLGMFVVMSLGLITIELSNDNHIKKVADFFISGFSDILHYRGTFRYRIEESWFRFDLIKKHPLLGPGFIHPKHLPSVIALFQKERPDIATVDSGWISILTDFGIVGVLWLILFLIFLVRYERNFQKVSLYDNFKYSELTGISKGILYFLLLGVIVSITHGFFTYEGSIPTIAISLGILDRIHSLLNKNENSN